MDDVTEKMRKAREKLTAHLGRKGRPTTGRNVSIDYNAGPYTMEESDEYIDFLYNTASGGYEIWTVPVGDGEPFENS